jgi:hypothetical protein
MATSTHKMSYSDLGALIRNVGTAAQKAQKEAVFQAAFYMKQTIEREIHGDLGGKDYFRAMGEKKTKSGKFVGVRPATNRVGVRFNVKGEYNPTALLAAYGPMGLLEYGAGKHDITARLGAVQYAKGRKGARKRALQQRNLDIAYGAQGLFAGARPLRTPFGPRYRVNDHPGARPKKTFSRGVEKATPKATNIATSLIQSRVIQRLRTQYGEATYVLGEAGAFRPVVG